MPRICDAINKSAVAFVLPPELRSYYSAEPVRRQLKEDLSRAERFIIDNVNDYINSIDKSSWDLTEIPCLAPPFDLFWMEYRLKPEHIKSSGLIGLKSVGALFYTMDKSVFGAFAEYLRKRGAEISPDVAGKVNGMLMSVVFISACSDGKREDVFGPLGQSLLMLDEMGRLLTAPYCINPGLTSSPEDAEEHNDRAFLLRTFSLPAFVAISFLHCKNVVIANEKVDGKLQHAFKKRHGIPMSKFKVLKIEPMKQVLQQEGQVNESGITQALHKCRAHFKDYREKGLFGKHKAIFFFSECFKGNPLFGAIRKTYDVHPPKH